MSKLQEISSYSVQVEDGDLEFSVVVSARSHAAAKYQAFNGSGYKEWDVPFLEYCKIVKSVRKLPQPVGSYDYIREHYGLDISPGEAVLVCGHPATVAEPPTSGESYVHFIYASGGSGVTHPGEVRKVLEA